MTTNGRGSDSDARDRAETPRESEPPGQSSSGVFRSAPQLVRREAGWTVAEQFVRDGFYYRLMRRPLELEKAPPRLTKREEDALALACAGHSNKRIAQELDVSPSTVGVLLFRAAGKLNAKSRSELLANYEQFKAAQAAAEPARDEEAE